MTAIMPLANITTTPCSSNPANSQTYQIIRARETLLAIGLLTLILAAGAFICYICVFRDPEPGLAPMTGDTWSTTVPDGERYGDNENEAEIGVEGSEGVRREAVIKGVAEREENERNYAEREAMESDALMEGFDSSSHLS